MNGLRPPIVVGIGARVGASTVRRGLHADAGGERVPAADVVVCGSHGLDAAVALFTAPSGPRPVLAVTPVGGPPTPARIRALQQCFGGIVLLPHVTRWTGLVEPPVEVTELLGLPFEDLSRPLQAYAAALRLLTAAVVRSGRLAGPAATARSRHRSRELWRGLRPVERAVCPVPGLLDDDALDAAGGVAGEPAG